MGINSAIILKLFYNSSYFYFDTLVICRPFWTLRVICLPVFTNMLVHWAFYVAGKNGGFFFRQSG
ncbi:MAG: hypothetical protein WBI06_02465 [Paludibacter sp.]